MKKVDPSVKPPAIAQMEEFLKRYVMGQPKPIEAVARAYGRLDSGFKNFSERYRDKPIGCFFLLGPSGVGKTELAKRLAQFFYNTRSAFTLIECVNYKDRHEVAKLIGAPPGYIGHGDPPRLSKEKLYSKIPGYDKKVPAKSRHEKTEKPKEKTAEDFEDMLLRKRLVLGNSLKELKLIEEKIFDIDKELEQIEKVEAAVVKLPEEVSVIKTHLLWSKRDLQTRRKNILSDYLVFVFNELKKQAPTKEIPDKDESDKDKDKDKKEIKLSEKSIDEEKPRPQKTKEPVLIILFDEIEKADPSLHDFLLQIMEEGKTTLGNGEEIDLRNAFILMTSNAGSEKISNMIHGKKNQIGFTAGDRKKDIYEAAMAELRTKFSNEFLSRLDEILVFNELTLEDYSKIFDLLMEEFRFALQKKQINLVVVKGRNGESVKETLLKESVNKPDQARFLQKLFREKIIDPIESLVTTSQLSNGEVLVVTANGNELVFVNWSRHQPTKSP